MIKFRTGVKIRSGIRMGHGESVEENPLVIWLTRNPDLINIEYNGGAYFRITYTEGSARTALEIIDIEEPNFESSVYKDPFPPQDVSRSPYKCVIATAWDVFMRPIASNRFDYQLEQPGGGPK